MNIRRLGLEQRFQEWLRGQFAANAPYNETVSQIILAKGQAAQTGPALFYTALKMQPEELAASTSKFFCGVQIQCAQCHDHPFDHWTRKDFWGYAAFFARLQKPLGDQQAAFQATDTPTGEVKIPDTDDDVMPQFLGGVPSKDNDRTRRIRLAEWLTSKDNPYFARATVNRVWALMFGRGLVDPVDDLGAHNPSSHPELLDELSNWFAESGFDLQRLVRVLARTKAYNRSSRIESGGEDAPELFARMAIKSLTAEQLYDCLIEAMKRRDSTTVTNVHNIPYYNDVNRQEVLEKLRSPTQGATQYEGGIPQALTLMNGSMIRQATDISKSDLLLALDAPFFTDEGRLEVLFLSTLSRKPTPREHKKLTKYVTDGGVTDNRREALADILWGLLNSSEFVLNH